MLQETLIIPVNYMQDITFIITTVIIMKVINACSGDKHNAVRTCRGPDDAHSYVVKAKVFLALTEERCRNSARTWKPSRPGRVPTHWQSGLAGTWGGRDASARNKILLLPAIELRSSSSYSTQHTDITIQFPICIVASRISDLGTSWR
jgi:hypothetical protein